MNQAINMNEISTVSSVLLSTLEEGIFFGKLSSFIQEMMGEHKVLIFKTYQDHATQLVADSGIALEGEQIFDKAQGLAAYVSRIKRAYISNNVQRDPLFSGLDMAKEITSEVCVPVISEGMILCTINVQSIEEGRNFGEEDVNKVLELLTQLKAPIANMRLYLLAKHLNRELLNKIALRDRELLEKGGVNNKSEVQTIEVVGQSKVFTGLMELMKKVASEDYPVLFEGENGSGKRQLAKKLHSFSDRAAAKCTIIHCNVENEAALEVEIFGRGEEAGILELSNGGSIILKEIENLSPALQTRVLKVLTCGKVRRMGSDKAHNVNVRVISTSRKNMKLEVEEGRFREDLYYRLNTIKIAVPNLSERLEDMKILASHFLNVNKSEEEQKTITNRAVEVLCDYNWPGNLQELKSIMERTFILTDGKYIEEGDLPMLTSEKREETVEEVLSFEESSLFELEKRHIISTLDHLAGNKTRAAKSLGITVKTLYNKLHNYGLVVSKA
jgi:Nif-specific regulatory protein